MEAAELHSYSEAHGTANVVDSTQLRTSMIVSFVGWNYFPERGETELFLWGTEILLSFPAGQE